MAEGKLKGILKSRREEYRNCIFDEMTGKGYREKTINDLTSHTLD